METLSEWLEQEIAKREWKPADLARRASIPDATLSRILSQTRRAGPDVCLSIARALNEPPEKIFRLAGLLPPLPPAVEEEREAVSILRNLPDDVRAIVMMMLRSLRVSRGLYVPREELLADNPSEQGDSYRIEGEKRAVFELFDQVWDQVPDSRRGELAERVKSETRKYFESLLQQEKGA